MAVGRYVRWLVSISSAANQSSDFEKKLSHCQFVLRAKHAVRRHNVNPMPADHRSRTYDHRVYTNQLTHTKNPRPCARKNRGTPTRKLRLSHVGHVPHSRLENGFRAPPSIPRASPYSLTHPRNVNVSPINVRGNQSEKVNIVDTCYVLVSPTRVYATCLAGKSNYQAKGTVSDD